MVNSKTVTSWLFCNSIPSLGFKVFVFAVVYLVAPAVTAQKYDQNWVFGLRCGINFQDTFNVQLYFTNTSNLEANASISDSSGNLLFYIGRDDSFDGGMNIYDKNHAALFNGDSIRIERSATNGAIILPHPGSDSLFYLFHKDFYESFATTCPQGTCYGFYRTVIKIEENGNLAVVEKNIPLLTEPSGEKIAAVRHANGKDWWLLLQATPRTNNSFCTNKFYTYLFTKDSLHLSTQNIGAFRCDSASHYGEMTFNRQGTQLAAAITYTHVLELFDFDRCTGELFNHRLIDSRPNILPYGCEFSPNGRFLYVCDSVEESNTSLVQYDLSNFSRTWLVTLPTQGGQLQLAPDGKIYFSAQWNSLPLAHVLQVINLPDSAGFSCNFQLFGLHLGDSLWPNIGLPNMPNYELGPLTIYQAGAGFDKVICTEDTTVKGVLLGTPAIPGVSYSWYPADSLSHTDIAQPFASLGSSTWFYVTLTDTSIKNSCQSRTDSVFIEVKDCSVSIAASPKRLNFILHPNPTTSTLHITLPGAHPAIRSITLTDLSGKEALRTTQTTIPVSSLPAGLYFVKVELQNGESAVRKVIVGN